MQNNTFTPYGAITPKPISFYLNEQESTLEQLYALLKDERLALRKRDLEKVSFIAEQKSALMMKLQGNDQKIRLNPQAAKLKNEFASRVEEIKASLCECKKLNAINGRLITLALNSTRRLSSILMQTRDRTTRNLTYTDKGCTVARGPMRVSIEC